jgi:fused signal recognition particle receptor
MNTLLIVLGVVVIAIVAFVALRKPPELPPTRPEKERPLAETKENKRLEGGRTEKRGEAPPVALPEPISLAPAAESLHPTDVISVSPSNSTEIGATGPGGETARSTPPLSSGASKKDVLGIRRGLAASRSGFVARLTALLTGKKEIDPAILEQIEEVMLASDVGVRTTRAIVERLREALGRNELKDVDAVWAALRAEATRVLSFGSSGASASSYGGGRIAPKGRPTVVLMVGVNGVGKTTTIGKLATRLRADGKKVMLAAGDTFRAAAVQQLEVWGQRVGADVVKGKDGGDPGAVAFEATTMAKEADVDFLLIDTAGRLHTKTPLMDEIKKVRKSIGKAMAGAPQETLLVIDATTGQNALAQAALFKDAVELTGIVLTKLDGTAKGGIVLGICDELRVPVRYIGLGERSEDLREFQPEDFVEALFGRDGDEAAAA